MIEQARALLKINCGYVKTAGRIPEATGVESRGRRPTICAHFIICFAGDRNSRSRLHVKKHGHVYSNGSEFLLCISQHG